MYNRSTQVHLVCTKIRSTDSASSPFLHNHHPITQYVNFYRPMLCIRGTSHGPVSVCPSVCPSVRPSVHPSQAGVLLKRQNVGSHKQHHTIVPGLQFPDAKDLREIRPGSPPTRAPNAGGVGQNRRLSTNSRLYLEKGKR